MIIFNDGIKWIKWIRTIGEPIIIVIGENVSKIKLAENDVDKRGKCVSKRDTVIF